MRRGSLILTLFAALVALSLVTMAWADEENQSEEKKAKEVKKLSGKELYRGYCKSCHGPDSPHDEYTPMHLIQDQWDRFFDKKYLKTHNSVIDSLHGNLPVTEVINEDMLKKIRKFATEGAADSEHPMTCG